MAKTINKRKYIKLCGTNVQVQCNKNWKLL